MSRAATRATTRAYTIERHASRAIWARCRQWVSRWNTELGGAWKDEEIDAVTRYLNQRFYKFPCPARLCKGDKA